MHYRAALFDLDGTLLNTLDDLADSANLTLRRMGAPVHPVDAYRYFVGEGMVMLARRALPAGRRDEPTIERFVADMRRTYAVRQTMKTRPYEGVDIMLYELARRGTALAILSNKPDDAVQSIVAAMLPSHHFAFVRGVLPDVPRKPDPAGALLVAQRMGLPPEAFCYVGDTATDMQTAVAAGMYPVGAAWGFRDERELREHGAAVVVHTPLELLALWDTPGD